MLTPSYRKWPESLWSNVTLSPVSSPTLLSLNEALAARLGFDATWLAAPEGVAMLAGCHMPADVIPVAQAYAGHQFGQFVPSLGDGRAMLLGTVQDREGTPFDVQLKGAGRTVFSRNGDGRAAIGPVLREYLLSEAMHAMGVSTTRALVAVATGEDVLRDRALPGAILTRVSRSFLRVGSFQFAACRGDVPALRAVVLFAAKNLYADRVIAANDAEPDIDALRVPLFDAVADAHADLIAHWMSLGFIHGVMNTDNMSIAGETIDYGPCAFLDSYVPDKVFSGIDVRGRYAFNRQADVARWNLARFAETLLFSEDDAAIKPFRDIIDDFPTRFQRRYRGLMAQKLGLPGCDAEDEAIIDGCLAILTEEAMDYTSFFLTLPDRISNCGGEMSLRNPHAFQNWAEKWAARVALQPGGGRKAAEMMSRRNPAVIPRNHQVEKVIMAAECGDLQPFHQLLDAVTHPFQRNAVLEQPPTKEEEVHTTWCGT
ncbi:YdiU family protein [Candidatus Kirkpatrickella diaphorinae]|uniref:Protein nucleotidyltransferase YdiU n=1 Tax=Candidatus Kirkpatrickella diaphorinae TaxID=2984322 RepID=A0ABY6GI54_9PROT|nr:YdiU family protein [Candidatus Kirkpatrickella diaphorinae]UYH51184.1 YdiU family protein [Candidatus Kirkpatrickella diaphorinae]